MQICIHAAQVPVGSIPCSSAMTSQNFAPIWFPHCPPLGGGGEMCRCNNLQEWRCDSWQAIKQQRGWQVFGTNWYQYKLILLENNDQKVPFWWQFWCITTVTRSKNPMSRVHSLHVHEFTHGFNRKARNQTALRLESFDKKSWIDIPFNQQVSSYYLYNIYIIISIIAYKFKTLFKHFCSTWWFQSHWSQSKMLCD